MEENTTKEKSKFLLVGMVISVEFQRARFYIERLCMSLPKLYEKPDIRPLLNVDWYLYLTKIRRKLGGRVWTLQKNVVAFLDNNYIGDDDDLFKYLQHRIRIRIAVDFYVLGVHQLKNLLAKSIEDGHKFAYLSVAIAGISIGSMLFVLYQELVPKATEIFLKRCESQKHGWRNRKIHRIVENCWIQGGGFDLKNKRMPCENYIISHDKRGVLSLCNGGKHTNNNIQFIISLNPTPWMDYKYVAFGQLIQGEEILRKIEAVDTRYQDPKQDITILLCGEYKLDLEIDSKAVDEVMKYYETIDEETNLPEDVLHPDDASSDLSESRYYKGDYCLQSDLKSNLDAMHLPSYLIRLYMEYTGMHVHHDDDEEATGDYDNENQIRLVPITEDLKYQASIKMSERMRMEEQQNIENVDEYYRIDSEIVQKVIEFDTIPAIVQPGLTTSSEVIDQEEQKRMFI